MSTGERDARRRGRSAIDAQIAIQHPGRGESDIGDARTEHAGGVEMPRHVFDADRRDQPVRRLEAGDAAKRGGPDHRTRRLRAEGDRHHAGSDRGGGAGRGAARGVRGIVWIAGHGGNERRELRRHRLADHDAAGPARQRHRGGVGRRPIAGIDRRAVLRRQIGGGENVLKCHRQAAQRQGRQSGGVGRTARGVEIERDEGADLLLARGDGIGAELDSIAGFQFAGLDAAGKSSADSISVPSCVAAMWPERLPRIKGSWLTNCFRRRRLSLNCP